MNPAAVNSRLSITARDREACELAAKIQANFEGLGI
jgi:hypothetical protein